MDYEGRGVKGSYICLYERRVIAVPFVYRTHRRRQDLRDVWIETEGSAGDKKCDKQEPGPSWQSGVPGFRSARKP